MPDKHMVMVHAQHGMVGEIIVTASDDPYPGPTAALWWNLFYTYWWLGLIVSIAVFGFLAYALLRSRGGVDEIKPGVVPEDRGRRGPFILIMVLMAGILFALLINSTETFYAISSPPGSDLRINVTAFQWGFRFTYPNGFTTVNQLVVPMGEPVDFLVTSQDVFHAFAIPQLKIKADAIPGVVNLDPVQ
jgi:cytochrome c oxidase subunit 2